MTKINPFRPNSPVSPGMFVGRLQEVHRIEERLIQAKSGNPASFLLTGERGIGKSSMLLYTKWIADGSINISPETKCKFLVVITDIDQNTTQLGLIRKIEVGLRHVVEQNDTALALFKKGWEFLKRVESHGVSLGEENAGPMEVIIEEAAYAIASTINAWTSDRIVSDWGISSKYDGMLLLIDEADNASKELQLGSFLKLLLERVQRASCEHFLVGLAGLPKVRDILRESHESSLRTVEEIELLQLTNEETEQVIDIGLKQGSEKNKRDISINPAAKQLLVRLSEGFPHFIQQFCSCAFSHDTDWNIAVDDVQESAIGRGGAIDLIGNRYYRDGYYNKIRQESYRKVLRIMASLNTTWVKKADIKKQFKGASGSESLDNAIHALISKNFIIPKEGERGVYRLVHRGFAAWIQLFAQNSKTVADFGAQQPQSDTP